MNEINWERFPSLHMKLPQFTRDHQIRLSLGSHKVRYLGCLEYPGRTTKYYKVEYSDNKMLQMDITKPNPRSDAVKLDYRYVKYEDLPSELVKKLKG